MDILTTAGCLLVFALIMGVPIYFLFFGMAGRSWKEIKDHDEWKRNQKK